MTKASVHNMSGLNVWRVVVQCSIEIPTVQEGGATNAKKWCQIRVQKAISESGFILLPKICRLALHLSARMGGGLFYLL
jgi:hypothetical protein